MFVAGVQASYILRPTRYREELSGTVKVMLEWPRGETDSWKFGHVWRVESERVAGRSVMLVPVIDEQTRFPWFRLLWRSELTSGWQPARHSERRGCSAAGRSPGSTSSRSVQPCAAVIAFSSLSTSGGTDSRNGRPHRPSKSMSIPPHSTMSARCLDGVFPELLHHSAVDPTELESCGAVF